MPKKIIKATVACSLIVTVPHKVHKDIMERICLEAEIYINEKAGAFFYQGGDKEALRIGLRLHTHYIKKSN